MASLTATRSAIADALNELTGVTVYDRPIALPKTLDGWVVISRIVPSDFARCFATFTIVVSLGTDITKAEELFETHAVSMVNAITDSEDFYSADVSAEAQALVAGTTASPIYAIAITMTAEVD